MSASHNMGNRNRSQIDWLDGRRAALTVSFDDGYLGTIEASLPLLNERGLKATYSIITGAVGAKFEGLLTAGWDTLQIMREQGHELACHSDRHLTMANWTAEIRKLLVGMATSPQPIIFLRQIIRTAHALTQQPKNPPLKGTRPVNNLKASKLELEQHLPGLQVSSFVYPTGRYNQASQHEVSEAGFLSARTALPGINQAYTNPFILRGLTWSPGAQIAEITPWLDLVLKRNGWLVVVFHYVATESPGIYPYFCASQDFQKFLDKAGQRRLWIATQGEIARYIYEKNHSDGLKSEW